MLTLKDPGDGRMTAMGGFTSPPIPRLMLSEHLKQRYL
jgi:hypothetical protein